MLYCRKRYIGRAEEPGKCKINSRRIQKEV